MIGVGQDEDSAKMPPPKLGMIQINITSIVTNNFWSQAILAKTIINWDHFYVIMAFNICWYLEFLSANFETIYSEYSPSAISISADFAAVRFIFLGKIRLIRYEKYATMQIFLKNPHSSEFYTAL